MGEIFEVLGPFQIWGLHVCIYIYTVCIYNMIYYIHFSGFYDTLINSWVSNKPSQLL